MIRFSLGSYKDVFSSPIGKGLTHQHKQEIDDYGEAITLSPNLSVYEMLESQGALLTVLAHDEERLVGYVFVVITDSHLFKDTVIGITDAIFLEKSSRKGMAGLNMIKFAEKELSNLGVDIFKVSVNHEVDFSNYLQRNGYKEIETTYGKWLGE